MKILLITDQHFGVRNDNQFFINHYKKFYGEIVIPFIKASGISTVIALGDTFDRRRSINFMSLDEAKQMWFDPLEKMGVDMHMLVGNHDIYYKNTLRINAPSELLGQYGNITVYDKPTTVIFDNCPVLLLPWICDGNYDESLRSINESDASVCMGHLEFNGFEAHPGHMMEGGMDHTLFKKYKRVFSGHYHMKSKRDNVTYLGNPYQITWSDYKDPRGFHIFDTETRELEFILNPYEIFHKIYYDDEKTTLEEIQAQDYSQYEGCYVKVIVVNKKNPFWFDTLIDKLYKVNAEDISVVENFDIEDFDTEDLIDEAEDTITILSKYVNSLEVENKKELDSLMKSLYTESLTVETL